MKKWYDEGVRFQCQGSGKCCSSRGQYGYVYMTKQDRKDMAKALGFGLTEFTKTYCGQAEGVYYLKNDPNSPDCVFLDGNKCEVYEGRPTQCRTWPFWPDHMNAKDWNKEVVSFCPGAGKGKLYSKKQIEEILNEEKQAEKEIFGE